MARGPGIGRHYVWGAPAFGPARAGFLDLLKRQHAVPSETEKYRSLDEFLDRIADRLTDKSAALLQNVAVFAGIFGLLLFSGGRVPDNSSSASMVFFLFASALLSRNLSVVWPKLSLGTPEEPAGSEEMREAWRSATAQIICRRAVRHTVALWLLVPAVLLGAWSLSATVRSRLADTAQEACDRIPICQRIEFQWPEAFAPETKSSKKPALAEAPAVPATSVPVIVQEIAGSPVSESPVLAKDEQPKH